MADDQSSGDVSYAGGDENSVVTTYDIRSRRFGTRVLGLNPREVAAFLDEIAEALLTSQRLNIELEAQIRLLQKELTTKQALPMQSDAFPDTERQATSIVPQTEQTEAAAGGRLELLRTTALQEVETLLHDAQARAQAVTEAAHVHADGILREVETLKSQRAREAEELLTQAKAVAESIVIAARDQETAIRQEIDRLAERRHRLFDDVWATLDACHEWLATADPRRQGRGADEPNELSESRTNAVLVGPIRAKAG
jgi:DivIVA domain-containing protein